MTLKLCFNLQVFLWRLQLNECMFPSSLQANIMFRPPQPSPCNISSQHTHMGNVYTHIPSRWAHAMTATFPVSLAPSSSSPPPAVTLPSAVTLSSWFKSISGCSTWRDSRQGLPRRSTGSFLSLPPAFLHPRPFRSPSFRLSLPLYASLTWGPSNRPQW